MSVHVGEIATQVSLVGPGLPPVAEQSPGPPGPGAAEEDWAELARRAAWLADRVRAEGFHD